MDLAAFRRRLLDALQSARRPWPDAHLYVLYEPGPDDTLGLAGRDEPPRRVTAPVPWAQGLGHGHAHFPQVIELDCRRVAPYLLESDPALDDPLLEETITLAHRDMAASGLARDRAGAGCRVGGWLASPDSAATIARRFASAAHRLDPAVGRRIWLPWHDPRTLALLWPQMTGAQRAALLGTQLTWLALDAAGQLVEFSSPPAGDAGPVADDARLSLTTPQWRSIGQLGVVNHLVDAWREQRGEPRPRGATEAVHRLVLRAQEWGLDGRDVQVFVLVALQLRQGFENDADLRRAVNGAARHPGTLSDRMDELPHGFWTRHALGP